MSLRSIKNITRQYWDIIPMPDTVIDRVNPLVKYQQQISVFNDSKVQIIGYDDGELTGVDGDENDAPLKIENENDLKDQEDQDEVHPEQQDQTIIQQPVKV